MYISVNSLPPNLESLLRINLCFLTPPANFSLIQFCHSAYKLCCRRILFLYQDRDFKAAELFKALLGSLITGKKMDQQGHGQPPGMGVGGSAQVQYGVPAYQANQMMGSTPPASAGIIQSPQAAGLSSSPAQLAQHQLAYQQIHQQQQQQLQQQLQSFWASQYQEIEQVTDFKNHSLPLARIKKIMKADEDVRMISAEAPVIFARACEMFILELTLRSWNHTEENKRRTLQKNDIAAAITRTDIFDFLVDIVPREDLKDEVLAATIPRGPLPARGPAEGLPYYYMPPQPAAQVGSSGMYMGKPVDQALYGQQPRPYMAPLMWPQQPQPPEES
ncbi:nuclear transcription factor Y subunit C-3-like isoform X1 [Apium graveolens]|uniref:nuclear transcription factor Y subunit C-3-like isoform X1 n=2 Tax=Apium graveolens TaxID=4045 RepID=UPI003D7ADB75